jgi:uncharacterized protein
MTATLSRITVFPIKSLDGIEITAAEVLASGALANDRRFALIDSEGKFVNAKWMAAIHRIRAEYDFRAMTVRLSNASSASNTEVAQFSLLDHHSELSNWLSAELGIACRFLENATGGFPDDTVAPGPTLISTATLREVASWFPGMTLDETRRRFRANLEIDGVEPFWEDRLIGPPGVEVPFSIGEVRWLGITACQRCVVPTRVSETGDPTPKFQKTLAAGREASLPTWAARERFDHFYRLAVNTRLACANESNVVRVGDTLQLV